MVCLFTNLVISVFYSKWKKVIAVKQKITVRASSDTGTLITIDARDTWILIIMHRTIIGPSICGIIIVWNVLGIGSR